MKTLIVAFFMLMALSSCGQEAKIPSGIVKISPLVIFSRNTFDGSLELFSRKHILSQSMGCGLQLYRLGSSHSTKGTYLEYQLRGYYSPLKGSTNHKGKVILRGSYGGLFVNSGLYYDRSAFQSGSRELTKGFYGITGLILGIQRQFLRSLFLDFYCGLGVQWVNTTSERRIYIPGYLPDQLIVYDDHFRGYSGIIPKIGLKIGYSL